MMYDISKTNLKENFANKLFEYITHVLISQIKLEIKLVCLII